MLAYEHVLECWEWDELMLVCQFRQRRHLPSPRRQKTATATACISASPIDKSVSRKDHVLHSVCFITRQILPSFEAVQAIDGLDSLVRWTANGQPKPRSFRKEARSDQEFGCLQLTLTSFYVVSDLGKDSMTLSRFVHRNGGECSQNPPSEYNSHIMQQRANGVSSLLLHNALRFAWSWANPYSYQIKEVRKKMWSPHLLFCTSNCALVDSPAKFFNMSNVNCSRYDDGMIPFAKDLKSKMTRTAHHCKQIFEQPQFLKTLMDAELEDDLQNFQNHALW